MNFAVVDIETSGFAGSANKITEISIFIFDGEQVVDEYTSLVNPECHIPHQITALTGIDNAMVQDAPKFHEIADRVLSITEGCIFVAHNVNFDYGVIAKEFAELGGTFKRKKLCTVRYARKTIPGHKSYSLGNICSDLGIPINGRHRARGDAEATVILLQKALQNDVDKSIFNSFLKPKNKAATLPPNLDVAVFENLPNATGVYYFKDEQNKIIYVGKALDIKQRVLSHFHTKTAKAGRMLLEIAHIECTVMGSELLALLLESDEIKKHLPKYNKAQKKTRELFGLTHYENQQGILQLVVNRAKLISKPVVCFNNLSEAHRYIIDFVREFELCPKYCNIEKVAKGACFSYQLKQCKGVCCQKESIAEYNARVRAALSVLQIDNHSHFIELEGRSENEMGFVKIEEGNYLGYGFVEKNTPKTEWDKALVLQNQNSDTQSIISSYLRSQLVATD